MGEDGGVNLFVFAENNPIIFIDPYGLDSQPQFPEVKKPLDGLTPKPKVKKPNDKLKQKPYNPIVTSGELTLERIGQVLKEIENSANSNAGSQKYDLNGKAAEELLLGTAIAESMLVYRTQIGGGPALGLYQMEPFTYDDIWENFLKYQPHLSCAIITVFKPAGMQLNAQRLTVDDDFATIMARVHYLRYDKKNTKMPSAGDLKAQASYYVKQYNRGGKATEKKYIDAWKKYHGKNE